MKRLALVTFLTVVGISLLGWATYKVYERTEQTVNVAVERTVPNLVTPKKSTIISLPEFEKGLPQTKEVLVLEKKNTLVLDDVVTDKTVSRLQVQLMKMVNELDSNEPIYLVLNTPGGSIDAGTKLIESFKAQSNPIHTVTIFAASMGFIIAETLNDRIITPTGTLMSHRAQLGGLEGFLDGEYENRLTWIKSGIHYLDKQCADRMQMTFEEYKKLVHSEYWVRGFESVEQKAADKVMLIKCGKSLTGKHTVKIETFIGTFEVTLSDCPLIEAPLSIKYEGIILDDVEAQEFINMLYTDRFEFFEKYIKTNDYIKFLGR